MRIFVTGARGQLGNEIRRCMEDMSAEIGPIPSCYLDAEIDYVDYDVLDIADAHAVHRWFQVRSSYDLIINCAAITNVDGCESNEADAYHVNAVGAENIAREAQACGAKLVHVSTDYVFPGIDPEPRVEVDAIGPISAYGRTKWAGECLVANACERHFIVRTAWLYGYVGKNFVKTMHALGSSHSRITVVDDQLGNPTSANDLAYEILKVAATENYGTYHCTNDGTCSWAAFAKAIMEESALDCEVVAVTSAEYRAANPHSARRPAYSSLRNKHLEDTIGDEMRPWREALVVYLQNLPKLKG